jgi:DNA polymerase-3 subunit delta'
LLEAFRSNHLAHAILITGPRGIGKATLAYRFARFMLTHGGEGRIAGGLFGDTTPPASLFTDPTSTVFRRVAAGGHADLLTVERQVDDKGKMRSEIVVDDIRNIGPFLSLTPAEGGWRVVVIDCADDLNRNAANAVLKVLEEPPRRALLLMVSHNPGRLLPTIRSRCRMLVLKPLGEPTIATILGQYHPDLDSAGVTQLSRLAEGSIGQALALAEEGGLEFHRELENLFQSLLRLDSAALHALGDQLARVGAEGRFQTAMDLLRWRLSRLVLVCAKGPTAGADDDWAVRLAAAASLERWLEVWEKTNRLLARMESANLDRKQVVLNIFLALEDAVQP